MYANTAHDPQRLPCAQVEHSRRNRTFANDVKFRLQHYLCQMDPNATNNNLSHREFQMAFQHWVAYIRPSDCHYPSEATAKEHLMCPMLWCRETFNDFASTLQHISECPWLSNAWYWCPYCRRPENFMAYDEPCAESMQYKLQRKDSKLRRAVTFFKHLGLKSCSRHKNSGSSSTSESFDTWLAKRKRFEMEDTSHDTSSPMELADTKMGTHGHRLIPERQSKTVYEMEGTTLYNPWDLDDLPHYSQEASTAVEPHFQRQDEETLLQLMSSVGSIHRNDCTKSPRIPLVACFEANLAPELSAEFTRTDVCNSEPQDNLARPSPRDATATALTKQSTPSSMIAEFPVSRPVARIKLFPKKLEKERYAIWASIVRKIYNAISRNSEPESGTTELDRTNLRFPAVEVFELYDQRDLCETTIPKKKRYCPLIDVTCNSGIVICGYQIQWSYIISSALVDDMTKHITTLCIVISAYALATQTFFAHIIHSPSTLHTSSVKT